MNDAPEASSLDKQEVDEDATATYVVPAFTDKEDDAASKDLTYGAQRVVGGTPGALPSWITFVGTTRTFTFKPLATSCREAHASRHGDGFWRFVGFRGLRS